MASEFLGFNILGKNLSCYDLRSLEIFMNEPISESQTSHIFSNQDLKHIKDGFCVFNEVHNHFNLLPKS